VIIRFHGRGADISKGDQLPLRVHHHHPRGFGLKLAENLNDARSKNAVAVVGDDHGIAARHQTMQLIDQHLLRVAIQRVGAALIEAEQQLRLGDQPLLGEGAATGMGPDVLRRHIAVFQRPAQQEALDVLACQRQEAHLSAQTANVCCRVGGAAGNIVAAEHRDNRHQRLRAKPVGMAFQVAVEHGLADDKDVKPRKRVDQAAKVGIHGRCSRS